MLPAMRDWENYTIIHIDFLLQQIPQRRNFLSQWAQEVRLSPPQHQALLNLLEWERINHHGLRNHMLDLSSRVLGWQQTQSNEDVHNMLHPHNMAFRQLDYEAYNFATRDLKQKSQHTRIKNKLYLYQPPPHLQQTQPHTPVKPAEKRKHKEIDEGAEEPPSSKRPKFQTVNNKNSPLDRSHDTIPKPSVKTSAQVNNGFLTPESMPSPGEEIRHFMGHMQPKSQHQRQRQQTEHTEAAKLEADQIKVDQIKADQIKADQIKADQFKADQIKADHFKADQIKTDQITANQIKTDQIKADQCKVDQIRQAEEAQKYEEDRLRRISKNEAIEKAFQDRRFAELQKVDTELRARIKREAEAAKLARKEAMEAWAREQAEKDAEQQRKAAEQAEIESARLKAEENELVRLAEERASAPKLCTGCQQEAEKLHYHNQEIASLEFRRSKICNPLLKGRIQEEIEVHKQDIKQLAERSSLKIQDDRNIEPYWQCEHFMNVEAALRKDDDDDDDEDDDDYSRNLSGDETDKASGYDGTSHSQADNESEGTGTSNDKIEHDQANNVDDDGLDMEDNYDFAEDFQSYLDELDDEAETESEGEYDVAADIQAYLDGSDDEDEISTPGHNAKDYSDDPNSWSEEE